MLVRLSFSARLGRKAAGSMAIASCMTTSSIRGETSCANRIARLASLAGIKAQIGYKRRPGSYGGKPSVVVDNTLARQFDVDAPDRAWVTRHHLHQDP